MESLKEMCEARFFKQRVVGAGNVLPGMMESVTIVPFKQLLGRHMDMEG